MSKPQWTPNSSVLPKGIVPSFVTMALESMGIVWQQKRSVEDTVTVPTRLGMMEEQRGMSHSLPLPIKDALPDLCLCHPPIGLSSPSSFAIPHSFLLQKLYVRCFLFLYSWIKKNGDCKEHTHACLFCSSLLSQQGGQHPGNDKNLG